MKKITLTLMTALCVLNVSFAQIFVDDDATGANDGSSWDDAYTDLQTAIDAAGFGEEIWVAYGIYYPTKDKVGNSSPADDRTKTFYIDKPISIHGNFVGNETSLTDRVFTNLSPAASSSTATILSGDLLGPTGTSTETEVNQNAVQYTTTTVGLDNSYTVMHLNSSFGCLITGCIITAGNANVFGSGNEQEYGGGMYIESNNSVVGLCFYVGSFSITGGGGLYSNVDYSASSSSFFYNSSSKGGGVYNDECIANLSEVFFALNNATDGAAVANIGSGAAPYNCYITNGLFYSNSATGNGGSIFNDGTSNACDVRILNCAFTQSSFIPPSGNGGAIYSTGTSETDVYNSIFYGLQASSGNVFYNNGANATTHIEYSLVQGANATDESVGTVTAGDGMIYNEDPQFVDVSLSLTLDLTLKSNSPCINAGSNSYITSVPLDIEGLSRVSCGKVDMGPSERGIGKGANTRNRMLNLDGTSGYANLGNVLSSFTDASDFTIETWLRIDNYDATANKEIIFSNRDGNTGATFFVVGEQDGTNKHKLALQIGTTETIYYNDALIPEGEWTHVAVTYEYVGGGANIVKFYVNGVSLATANAADDIPASTANSYIAFETGTTDFTDSRFEEMRIWSTTRTNDEIRLNMHLLLSCGGPGALANYQFNPPNSVLENTYELDNDPNGDFTGSYVGGFALGVSDVVLSSGCSEIVDASVAGTTTVTNVDGLGFSLTFGASNNPGGEVVMTYLEEDYSGSNDFGGNTDLSIGGQFVVDNNALGNNTSGLDYQVTMFVDNSVDLSNGAANYTLMRRDANSIDAWIAPNAAGADAVNNSSTPKTISFSMTNYSLGQLLPVSGNVVPVEMTLFEAILKEKQVYLDWQTASELNNLGFEIEKSIDGRNWENIGFVEGKGTTFEFSDYQFIDENPAVGINYYRLKQLDTDGQFEFSDIRSIIYNELGTIAIYPNPTKDVVVVDLGNQMANIEIFDLTGRLIMNTNSNNTIQNIDFSNFENGIYVLRINGNGWQKVEKIVVQH